jgi:hypothetical protein
MASGSGTGAAVVAADVESAMDRLAFKTVESRNDVTQLGVPGNQPGVEANGCALGIAPRLA